LSHFWKKMLSPSQPGGKTAISHYAVATGGKSSFSKVPTKRKIKRGWGLHVFLGGQRSVTLKCPGVRKTERSNHMAEPFKKERGGKRKGLPTEEKGETWK